MAFVALLVVLAVGIGVIVGANVIASRAAPAAVTQPTTPVKHHGGQPAAKPVTMTEYRQLVANLAAAEARHDFAAQYRFGKDLDRMLTPAIIGTIYEQRAQLEANLEAATSYHDAHAQAMFTNQLSKLCGAKAIKAELDFCN
jgi:hypothetical protein